MAWVDVLARIRESHPDPFHIAPAGQLDADGILAGDRLERGSFLYSMVYWSEVPHIVAIEKNSIL